MNEIEHRLMKSAKNVKVKPYSEIESEVLRKKSLGDALSFDETSCESVKPKLSYKRPLMGILSGVGLLALSLTTIVLAQNQIPSPDVSVDTSPLQSVVVEEHVFYEEITSAEINIVDLTKYEIESFTLLQDENGVKGGSVGIIKNEEVMQVDFYSANGYENKEELPSESKKLVASSVEVEYYTAEVDGKFTTVAMATVSDVVYRFEFSSMTDNVMETFEDFFGVVESNPSENF